MPPQNIEYDRMALMDSLLTTAVLASFILFIGLLLLGIGWVITGKVLLKGGMCGRDPTKKKGSCDTDVSCTLCDKDKKPHDQ